MWLFRSKDDLPENGSKKERRDKHKDLYGSKTEEHGDNVNITKKEGKFQTLPKSDTQYVFKSAGTVRVEGRYAALYNDPLEPLDLPKKYIQPSNLFLQTNRQRKNEFQGSINVAVQSLYS